ncbi:hypothetical protein DERP_009793 [Dermatophagoides pteronyssinus]|uniref:Uncharacterized protein n=1 Tax=Dermatophagoides pteronyssinus TaxID=6956 RepID=A0ABQ8IRJ1_DERPT|nr:hypothetical protein DERP_009793 [Dermatophagoides pteronyssinus]
MDIPLLNHYEDMLIIFDRPHSTNLLSSLDDDRVGGVLQTIIKNDNNDSVKRQLSHGYFYGSFIN